MRIVEIALTDNVRWRIRRDNPATLELHTLPGWSLINPLGWPDISRNVRSGVGRYRLEGIIDDTIVIKSNELLLGGPDEGSSSEAMVLLLQDFVPRFLSHLRCQSKQTGLAQIHAGGAHVGRDPLSIPPLTFPSARPGEFLWIHAYDLDTTIRWEHIERANHAMAAGPPLLFAGVLLDAVLAFLDRDDRRTILYATMAIEVIAKTKLHAAGQPTLKGPQGETTMQRLLHRQPLEILGRSLQQDDLRLYQLAEHVYRTRNQLVHEGSSLSGSNVLPTDGEGAFHALECANAIFSWYGERDDYMPKHGHVIAEVPVGHALDIGRFPEMLPRAYQSALS